MGVNIYAKIKPSKNKLEEYAKQMQSAIMSGNPDKVNLVAARYELDFAPVHIGKYNNGWQFCFRNNDELYQPTKDSLSNFLKQDNITIYVEHGREISYEEFWQEYGNSKGYNFITYYENNPTVTKPVRYNNDDVINNEGMWWCNVEFF